jgi:hypothetical protein
MGEFSRIWPGTVEFSAGLAEKDTLLHPAGPDRGAQHYGKFSSTTVASYKYKLLRSSSVALYSTWLHTIASSGCMHK